MTAKTKQATAATTQESYRIWTSLASTNVSSKRTTPPKPPMTTTPAAATGLLQQMKLKMQQGKIKEREGLHLHIFHEVDTIDEERVATFDSRENIVSRGSSITDDTRETDDFAQDLSCWSSDSQIEDNQLVPEKKKSDQSLRTFPQTTKADRQQLAKNFHRQTVKGPEQPLLERIEMHRIMLEKVQVHIRQQSSPSEDDDRSFLHPTAGKVPQRIAASNLTVPANSFLLDAMKRHFKEPVPIANEPKDFAGDTDENMTYSDSSASDCSSPDENDKGPGVIPGTTEENGATDNKSPSSGGVDGGETILSQCTANSGWSHELFLEQLSRDFEGQQKLDLLKSNLSMKQCQVTGHGDAHPDITFLLSSLTSNEKLKADQLISISVNDSREIEEAETERLQKERPERRSMADSITDSIPGSTMDSVADFYSVADSVRGTAADSIMDAESVRMETVSDSPAVVIHEKKCPKVAQPSKKGVAKPKLSLIGALRKMSLNRKDKDKRSIAKGSWKDAETETATTTVKNPQASENSDLLESTQNDPELESQSSQEDETGETETEDWWKGKASESQSTTENSMIGSYLKIDRDGKRVPDEIENETLTPSEYTETKDKSDNDDVDNTSTRPDGNTSFEQSLASESASVFNWPEPTKELTLRNFCVEGMTNTGSHLSSEAAILLQKLLSAGQELVKEANSLVMQAIQVKNEIERAGKKISSDAAICLQKLSSAGKVLVMAANSLAVEAANVQKEFANAGSTLISVEVAILQQNLALTGAQLALEAAKLQSLLMEASCSEHDHPSNFMPPKINDPRPKASKFQHLFDSVYARFVMSGNTMSQKFNDLVERSTLACGNQPIVSNETRASHIFSSLEGQQKKIIKVIPSGTGGYFVATEI